MMTQEEIDLLTDEQRELKSWELACQMMKLEGVESLPIQDFITKYLSIASKPFQKPTKAKKRDNRSSPLAQTTAKNRSHQQRNILGRRLSGAEKTKAHKLRLNYPELKDMTTYEIMQLPVWGETNNNGGLILK